MNVATPAPHGTLDVVADPASRSRLSRLARAGRAIRLAPGLYALGATLPPEQVARHHCSRSSERPGRQRSCSGAQPSPGAGRSTVSCSCRTRIPTVLGQLDAIAASFDRVAVSTVRKLLVALLGTVSESNVTSSPRLAARLAGAPFDAHRIDLIVGLAATLDARAPRPQPALPPASRWEWLAFFEAYFSNFIEGAEFAVDEARRIAVEGAVPQARPEDAYDVSATYRLATDDADRARRPATGDELIEIILDRHRVLMAARPDKRPGQLKQVNNYVGGYHFVEPALVEGTLTRDVVVVDRLDDPLARAIAMMVLVTECHPFDDGNGRLARLTSNAELSAAGQVRALIPTVYRNDYLAALAGLSNGAGHGESLVAVLEYAQRWSAAVDWTTFERADATLTACDAYVDAGVADRTGRRLRFPQGAV